MARPLRLEFSGALYHVISRGNEKGAIFVDDEDRRDFTSILAAVISRETFLLHSYCLLGNHYHLLLETPCGWLSRGMHWLNGRYAQRFNARHERCGHLFEGRFKAILVEKESHLLELHRYIVLNPVRAGIVERPQDWRWSSYRATCGFDAPPPWLEVSWTLRQFGQTTREARRGFVEFVEAAMEFPEPPIPPRNRLFAGSRPFRAEMQALLGAKAYDDEIPASERTFTATELVEVETIVAREWSVPILQLRRHRGGIAKIAAIYLARKLTRLSAREVGAAFGVRRGRVANVIAEVDRGRHGEMRTRLESLMADLRAGVAKNRKES
jgi:REP element-mobilizing transposase RayT